MSQPPDSQLDQEAQAALAKTKLEFLTADPVQVDAFGTSTVSWKVTVPKDAGVSVIIDLNGNPVSASGSIPVSPESTASYQLRARALGYSRILGTATVHVDLRGCIALLDEPMRLITALIAASIAADTSGLSLRSDPGISVTISGNRMTIILPLSQKVDWLPDPDVDITASFAVAVVPIPGQVSAQRYDYHEVTAVDQIVSARVSFPWYVNAIPGALLLLASRIANGEAQGRAKAAGLITEVAGVLDHWFTQAEVQPPLMDKHDATFLVQPPGDQLFRVNFCPAPSGTVITGQ